MYRKSGNRRTLEQTYATARFSHTHGTSHGHAKKKTMFTCTQQTCFLSSRSCKSQNVNQSLQVASERETKTVSLRQYGPLARGLCRLEIPARHAVSTVAVAASLACAACFPREQLGVGLLEIVVPFARAIQYIYIYIHIYINASRTDSPPAPRMDGPEAPQVLG